MEIADIRDARNGKKIKKKRKNDRDKIFSTEEGRDELAESKKAEKMDGGVSLESGGYVPGPMEEG